RSGSDSQPSTSVHAAQCTTISGRRAANQRAVASPSARSESARACGMTSCTGANVRTTAPPSMPLAPVTTTRRREPELSEELDLTVVAHHEFVRLGTQVAAYDAYVPPQETALDARTDAGDVGGLEHDAVLDLAVFDAALRA